MCGHMTVPWQEQPICYSNCPLKDMMWFDARRVPEGFARSYPALPLRGYEPWR
jgi:hypothetical protein